MRLPLLVRMLFWVLFAQVVFAATSASAWARRLDALGQPHGAWLSMGLHFFVVFLAVAALAYAGAVAAYALVPDQFKQALAQRQDDRWAYAVAGLAGMALAIVWYAIFSGSGAPG